ncbi:MAG: peptidylprolyl isomerase [Candidatus Methylumidiphilus sp.]
MNKTYLIGAAVALLFGTSLAIADDDDAPSADAAATVNGKAISKNAVRSLISDIEKQSGEQNVPEDKAVESLISRELLRQEAEKKGMQKTPSVQGRLENVTRDVLAQAAVEAFRKTITITDEEARKEYDEKVAGADLTEFKARHILLETEQEANDVLAKLKKGGKFPDLAKKLSKDPSAKQNGGDLGWFNPQQMVPEFTTAVAALKNGEISSAPVQSKFGWHVIQREDSRKGEPPAFDTVKEQIRNVMVTQQLQKHVEDLKKAAKIENSAAKK